MFAPQPTLGNVMSYLQIGNITSIEISKLQ